MPRPSTVALLATASLVLLLLPGPAVLSIVTRSVGSGRRGPGLRVTFITLGLATEGGYALAAVTPRRAA